MRASENGSRSSSVRPQRRSEEPRLGAYRRRLGFFRRIDQRRRGQPLHPDLGGHLGAQGVLAITDADAERTIERGPAQRPDVYSRTQPELLDVRKKLRLLIADS